MVMSKKGFVFFEVVIVINLVVCLLLTYKIGGLYGVSEKVQREVSQTETEARAQAPNGESSLSAPYWKAHVMKCKNPYFKDPNGKVYSTSKGLAYQAVPFGCGQCMGCRINKVREWQHRIMLEASTHPKSGFVTLTFSDEHLPERVEVRELQLLLKRLRYYLGEIRYFGVGEYGDESKRPHYHLALFGVNDSFICPDCTKFKCPNIDIANRFNTSCEMQGKILCLQEEVMQAWKYGIVQVGEINRESAGYIAGYAAKGATRKDAELREFSIQSRKPPLGYDAVLQAAKDMGDVPDHQLVTSFRYGKNARPLGRTLIKVLMEARGQDGTVLTGSMNRWQDDLSGDLSDHEFPYEVYRSRAGPSVDNAEWKHKEFRRRLL